MIIEEHLEGSVYRGTVIDGKLVGVLGGDPPRITGDGKYSINELIKIKNENKIVGVSDFEIKDATHEFLKRQGYNIGTILLEGQTIDLTEKIGVSYGGMSVEVTDITHPEIKKALEHAGRVVNDPILCFDFIIKDVTLDPKEQKWGIIECNAVPFINLHHDPMIGKPVNVAGKVWDYVEKEMK